MDCAPAIKKSDQKLGFCWSALSTFSSGFCEVVARGNEAI